MRRRPPYAVLVLTAALLVFSSCRSLAHEVPAELTVQAFIKPAGRTLRLLVRVPLSGLMATGMPKEGVGYLALGHIGPSLHETALLVADAIDLYEDGRHLGRPAVVAARISLPYDASFASYPQALSLVTGPPLPVDTQVFWLQGNFDALLEYPIGSERSDFSIHARVTPLAPQVTTVLGFLSPGGGGGGGVRSFQLFNDAGLVWLDPHWYQAALVFIKLGFRSLLGAGDQWLFALCLLIPIRRVGTMLALVAAFALGHALTLLVLTYGPDAGAAWLPPLVETVAAALILYVSLENIAASSLDGRWRLALAFGVVSGIGFAVALRQMLQFSGRHLLVSVASFGAGAELGQLVAFAAVGAPLALLSRFFTAERMRVIMLSALAANVAWGAVVARAEQLPNADWPLLNAATLAAATSWLLVLVVAGGVVWLLWGLLPGGGDAAKARQALAARDPMKLNADGRRP